MSAYLTASIEEANEDAAFIAAALSGIARAYGTDRLASDAGVSPEGLREALSSDGNLSFAD